MSVSREQTISLKTCNIYTMVFRVKWLNKDESNVKRDIV